MKLTQDHIRIAAPSFWKYQYIIEKSGTPMESHEELSIAAQQAEHMAAKYPTTKPEIKVLDGEKDFEVVYTVKYDK